MYKWFISYVIPSAILFAGLFIVSSASAASIYDDVITVAEDYTIPCGESTISALNFYEIMTASTNDTVGGIDIHDSSSVDPNTIATFNNRLNDGVGWGVIMRSGSETYQEDPSYAAIEIFIQRNSADDPYFDDLSIISSPPYDDQPALWISPDDAYGVKISCSQSQIIFNDAQPSYIPDTATEEQFILSGRLFINDYEWEYYDPLYLNFDIVYPQDYEGVIPPDSYSPPVPPLDWTPDIHHVQSVDWKITLQDRNFNTFDPVPFTCNEGLAPVIQYDFYNNSTDPITKIDTGTMSPTIPYEFQADDYGVETEFKFIANYYCGDQEDDPTFSGQTTYYFTLNASGSYIPDTPSCFSEEFPYIDMTGCSEVIEGLVNNLSFGTITFPDWQIQDDGCHTLGIIGDWIHVSSSSRTICPQFSSDVRNIVTPFLTFVLGITIIGVLVTKSRKDLT